MGLYINKVNGIKLPIFDKVPFLKEHAGAKVMEDTPTQWEEDLVCVVENAEFDAAVYARDQMDLDRYRNSGGRPTHWLIVPGAKDLVGPNEP
jgi:hypothetical protein